MTDASSYGWGDLGDQTASGIWPIEGETYQLAGALAFARAVTDPSGLGSSQTTSPWCPTSTSRVRPIPSHCADLLLTCGNGTISTT